MLRSSLYSLLCPFCRQDDTPWVRGRVRRQPHLSNPCLGSAQANSAGSPPRHMASSVQQLLDNVLHGPTRPVLRPLCALDQGADLGVLNGSPVSILFTAAASGAVAADAARCQPPTRTAPCPYVFVSNLVVLFLHLDFCSPFLDGKGEFYRNAINLPVASLPTLLSLFHAVSCRALEVTLQACQQSDRSTK
ncbi:hypothetical protein FALBO_5802 [Fusarium albosuccineum]|uniref:Uncharacterized protein n=1 Tax=Fusarium albosuccineum TaxID=1237068 RepID=A0A8H4PCC4_9HYPO|nr:hypothetical protein FALBO_5802 [Fusarium albosuccineum]